MARPIGSSLLAALGAGTGVRRQLLRLEFGSGPIHLTTAGQVVEATTEDGTLTWTPVGGAMTVGPAEEKADMSGSGLEIVLSGVDQSIIAVLMQSQYRGRICKSYEIRIDPAAGTVIGDPLRTCRGRMNGEWRIEQTKAGPGGPTSVTVRTRVTDLASDLDGVSGIQMNVGSHQAYYPGDAFFALLPGLVDRPWTWGDVLLRGFQRTG